MIRTKCGFTTTKVVKIDASGDTPEITLFFCNELLPLSNSSKSKGKTCNYC